MKIRSYRLLFLLMHHPNKNLLQSIKKQVLIEESHLSLVGIVDCRLGMKAITIRFLRFQSVQIILHICIMHGLEFKFANVF